MRLNILNNGHRPLQRLQFMAMKVIIGYLPGPASVMSYNRNFFGKYYAQWLQATMRKKSEWTVGELELFAAFVSKTNQCNFCSTAHKAVCQCGLDNALVDAVISNWSTAPVTDKIRATLGFLEKLTQNPDTVTSEDIKPMLQAGVTPQGVEDAIGVCAVFCVINRLADAFNFKIPDKPEQEGKFLFKVGYGISSVRG